MMNLTLLAAQTAIGDTLAGGNPVLTPVSGEAQMNLWDMALKGGWIMAVLAVLSVVCFYIFFERLAVIRKAGKDDPMFMERIRDYIRTGEIKSAINYCRITNTPSALFTIKVGMEVVYFTITVIAANSIFQRARTVVYGMDEMVCQE